MSLIWYSSVTQIDEKYQREELWNHTSVLALAQ